MMIICSQLSSSAIQQVYDKLFCQLVLASASLFKVKYVKVYVKAKNIWMGLKCGNHLVLLSMTFHDVGLIP